MNKQQNSNRNTIDPEQFRKLSSEEKIMEFSKSYDTPAGKPNDEVLASIFERAENIEKPKTVRLMPYIRVAAAVVFAIISFYTVTTVFSKEKVSTRFAEQTEFKLPDQSEVTLNADSKLTYSKRDFNKSRELNLIGEAFFDVEKGTPFIITTSKGTVQVLGTQLNVFARNDEFWVSCLSGKVKVTSGDEEQIITPGEVAELSGGQLLKKTKINVNQSVSWKDGVFYFEDKPLVSIFAALERQFNVSVDAESNLSRSMTVSFSNKSLPEALDVICIPMDLKYEIRNSKVRIYDSEE
ncbi:FecR family protein [Maribellus sediminis]|uniref:FecR family protein n=1 Tax=Maribellus sediminis TaxID=2696285 RepID=UPI001431FBF2|nr:FecR domain-containing protein [Maribellus sediminis]